MNILSRVKNNDCRCHSYFRVSTFVLSLLLLPGCKYSEKTYSLNTDVKPNNTPLIAFISERSGSEQIYVANLDGSNQKKITNSKGKKSNVVFYGNRRTIAYIRHDELDKTGSYDIYTCDLSDGRETRLTSDRAIESALKLGPDKNGVVYCHAPGFDTSRDISLFSEGGINKILIKALNSDESSPTVNFTGDRIAFASNNVQERPRYSQFSESTWTETALSWPHSIFTVNSNGHDLKRLTKQDVGDCFDPSYSPEGNKIVFIARNSIRNKENYNIYSINTDGSELTSLFSSSTRLYAPQYSPNGLHIAFTEIKKTKNALQHMNVLYVMESNGQNPKKIVKDQSKNQSGAIFAPHGKKIIFTCWGDKANSRKDICTTDVDGNNFVNLTKNTGGGVQPNVQ